MNTRKIQASKDAYLLGMSLPIYFWTKGFGLCDAQRFTTKGWTETAIMLCKLNKSL